MQSFQSSQLIGRNLPFKLSIQVQSCQLSRKIRSNYVKTAIQTDPTVSCHSNHSINQLQLDGQSAASSQPSSANGLPSLERCGRRAWRGFLLSLKAAVTSPLSGVHRSRQRCTCNNNINLFNFSVLNSLQTAFDFLLQRRGKLER
jgi:hypothetical protein